MYRAALIAFVSGAVLMSASEVRTGLYFGHEVAFETRGGTAVYQGDIILGAAEALAADPASGTQKPGVQKAASALAPRLWPGAVIPFTIESNVPDAVGQRISAAIEHWQSKTPVRFVERRAEPDFVVFTASGDRASCASAVGLAGGRQEIRVPATCTTGDVIHEIGHAVGLWHQQERSDRNRFTTVVFEHIDRQYAVNFEQAIADQRDLGPYDFNSIMHYGAYDFSVDGAPVIETIPAGIPIGQRVGLSAGDAAAVRRLYGMPSRGVTVATTPAGLNVLVDGVVVRDGARFDYTLGSKHTVAAIQPQASGRVRYMFGSWSDGGAGAHEITVQGGDVLVIVNYVRQRQLTAKVIPDHGGTITAIPASLDGYYTERSYIQLAASPAPGFSFLNWSASPSTGANPKQFLVNQTLDISATFTTGPVTSIRSEPSGRTVLVDGVPVTTPRNFVWNAGEEHVLTPQETAQGGVRYRFNGWTDGGDPVKRIIASGDAREITATFSVQYRLLVQSNSLVELIPAAADGYYDRDTRVRARVQASAGSAVTWSGDVSGALNPALIVMDAAKTARAEASGAGIQGATVVNAASLRATDLAPGQLVTVYAPGAGAYSFAGSGAFADSAPAAGAAVTFDGVAAPVLSASATHVTTVVPVALAGRASAAVALSWTDGGTARTTYRVIEAAPALFTASGFGYGQALAFNSDGVVNSADNPARRGSLVELFATGIGTSESAPLTLRIAGVAAPLVNAVREKDGITRLAFEIPAGAPIGIDIPVYVAVDDQISPAGVTLAIR